MNSRNQSISEGIFQSFLKLRDNHEFEDLNIKVEGETFSCHSFILASCSDFFSALLRSDMKEKHEMMVEIKNISSSTFQLILTSLYTGCELLTKENVLDVWSAVHQLQIQFLIEHCEDFVMADLSLNNVGIYKEQADYLQSVRVREPITIFICKHFGTFRKTEAFLQMNYSDLIKIFTSEKLEVSSEDDVLYSIFDWVSYEVSLTFKDRSNSIETTPNVNNLPGSDLEKENENDQGLKDSTSSSDVTKLVDLRCHNDESNERETLLEPLLKVTRYSLASDFCLTMLYENKATQNNTRVKDIFFEALSFRTSGYWHGYCPISAINRECSGLRHVGVYCSYNELHVLDFKNYKHFSLPKLPYTSSSSSILPFDKVSLCNLAVHNGELYACIVNTDYTYSCAHRVPVIKLTTTGWESVVDLTARFNDFFVPNDKFIYCLNWKAMTRFNPNENPIELETFPFDHENIRYAFSFYKYIILFSYESNQELFSAFSWNTETQEFTELEPLKFSTINLVSFRKGRITYILNSLGQLWKLTQSETIGFTFVNQLWSEEYTLKGAFLFNETLFIVREYLEKETVSIGIEGVFSSIQFCKLPNISSNFVHYAIPTNMIKM